jgi:hypothetical protein
LPWWASPEPITDYREFLPHLVCSGGGFFVGCVEFFPAISKAFCSLLMLRTLEGGVKPLTAHFISNKSWTI